MHRDKSPNRDFRSDNTHGASPAILEAVTRAASGTATSYGTDDLTRKLRDRCREVFGRDCEVFPVITGTAGNALGLAAVTPPWGAIFCHADAHIQLDELGAAEFFSGSAKLIPIPGANGKLQPDALARAIEDVRDSKRTAVPACVSITNATEAGTVYSPDELRALIDVAKRFSLAVHIDGARYANAAAKHGIHVDGVDVLTLGATKNGALTADLIVLFRTEKAEELGFRHHRGGHRPSKMRFQSAQLLAYLENDLWLENARHANAMAHRLYERISDAVEVVRPVDANMLFARFSDAQRDALFADGFQFFDWSIFGRDVYRLVVGFSTSAEDVDAFGSSIRSHAK